MLRGGAGRCAMLLLRTRGSAALGVRVSCRLLSSKPRSGKGEVKDAQALGEVDKMLSPLENYRMLCQKGLLREDGAQLMAMKALERVYDDVSRAVRSNQMTVSKAPRPAAAAQSKGIFSRLFGGGDGSAEENSRPSSATVKGAYLYGGVGCGKTFLMDIFYLCAPLQSKRRTHFHKFMLEVHQRLHSLRQSGKAADVVAVADAIVESDGLLFCFDEFNVTDVGDAVILRGLFERMWDRGAVLVSTSNRHPTELYKNGIQRDLFVPCIEQLQRNCVVHDMSSQVDHRLLSTADGSAADTYIVTDGDPARQREARRALDKVMYKLVNGKLRGTGEGKRRKMRESMLVTQGRSVPVPLACAGVAQFAFSDLCSKPLGAADFLIIARAFHSVILTDIPTLSLQRLPEVRRLITLVDVLYDHKVKLLVSADKGPFELFQEDEQSSHDEAFAFDRTASRLRDMQSEEYKRQPHTPPLPSDVAEQDRELIEQVRVIELGEDDLDAVWRRYDADRSDSIDRDELRCLLQDVSMLRAGHPHVPEEVLDEVFVSMDENHDGSISRDEFQSYCSRSGISLWYV